MANALRVEVCYGELDKQVIISINMPLGSTVLEAIELSKIRDQFPDINLDKNLVGIFNRKVSLSQVLRDGDRVEIYRPLKIDPKEFRRLKSSRDDRS